jgi:hypothetical protein
LLVPCTVSVQLCPELSPRATNPADGPSRQPDYMAEAQKPFRKYNEAFVEPMRDVLSNNVHGKTLLVSAVTTRSTKRSKAQNRLREGICEFQKVERARIKESGETEDHEPMEDLLRGSSSKSGDKEGQNGPDGGSKGHYGRKELTTTQEKADAPRECHDNPLAGHFGTRRPLERLQCQYTWAGMRKDVTEYCKDCLACRKSTPARHKPFGQLPFHHRVGHGKKLQWTSPQSFLHPNFLELFMTPYLLWFAD